MLNTQGTTLHLHESCLENRSIRSLDALIADEEIDIDARDKVHIIFFSNNSPSLHDLNFGL